VVEKDFSKCQCEQAGWCDLLKKEMTASPPNWQWCKNLTEQQRKDYYDKVNGTVRTIRTAIKSGRVDVVNFSDTLPKKKNKYAVCVIPASPIHVELLKLNKEGIKRYAEKCQADYIELSGDQNPSWPMANKYRLYQVTNVYDKTLYLDCDIQVKDDAPNIFKITPDDKISAFDEWDQWENKSNTRWIQNEQDVIIRRLLVEEERNKFLDNGKFTATTAINGGVLVIPKSLAEYYQQPDRPYPKQWCFDQHLLSILLPEDKLNKLNYKFNCCYTSNNFFWNQKSAYFVHFNNIKDLDKRKRLIVLSDEGRLNPEMMIHEDVSLSERFATCKMSLDKQIILNKKLNSYINTQEPSETKIEKVCILVLGHKQEQFDSIKPQPYLKKVNLNSINAGEYSGNEWAESRAFISKQYLFPNNAEYYGFVTASWNNKYEDEKIDNFHNWFSTSVLLNSKPEDKIFLCADMFCPCEWLHNPGIMGVSLRIDNASKIVKQFVKMVGLSTRFKHRPVPFSNQGIYHKSIYYDYKKFLEDNQVFDKLTWLIDKHDVMNNEKLEPLHAKRVHAYFMEAINTMWLVHSDYTFIANTNRKIEWYGASKKERGW
jgi:hypothetical protein